MLRPSLFATVLLVAASLFTASLFTAGQARAQDSVFKSYNDYMRYVDTHVMIRDFVPMILRLGGRDEFSDAQLQSVNKKLMAAMPQDFSNSTVLKRVNLGSGFRQEARVYWNDNLAYAYFYALLHETPGGLVVLRFTLNTNADAIFNKF